jgi:uncharacterized protein
VPGFKVIHDSVHGSVRVDGVFLSLLERPEMQRLHGVHQLGLAHYVFPGANHTRLEHSLGTFHLARQMADALQLPAEDHKMVLCAALLHDLGHAPFSHTLEEVIHDRTGWEHADISKALIEGTVPAYGRGDEAILGQLPPIAEILEADGVPSREVSELITASHVRDDPGQELLAIEGLQAHFGQKNYLRQIVSGPLDVDQMDYLLRDAYYTGVAHGTIDIDRLLQTVAIFHGDLVINKGGMVAAEGLLVARALMYTSVYFHKTVRIAEMMLCKAVELAPPDVIEGTQVETDCSLTAKLLASGGESARIMTLLKYRRLYKKAVMLPISGLEGGQVGRLIELTDYRRRKSKEREIAERAGISPAEVILDLPEKSLLLFEPRIGKTDAPILDGDRVKPLSRFSPLAKAIQSRSVHDWAVMVSTPAEHKSDVEKAAIKVLFA